jgi:hypothetical protein
LQVLPRVTLPSMMVSVWVQLSLVLWSCIECWTHVERRGERLP